MSSLIPCTVQILTRNSGATLEACLATLTSFAEIIMVDGGSTDATCDIAKAYPNVRIINQDKKYQNQDGRITDYAGVRNQALAAASFPWILAVDSDEQVSPQMLEAIRSIVESGKPAAYQVFRRFVLHGEKIMFAAGYPAYQVRFFHRECVEVYEKPIHERPKLKPGVQVRVLSGDLLTPLPPASSLWPKYRRYLAMDASRLQNVGWQWWVKWGFARNVRTIVGVFARAILIRLIPRGGKRLPMIYEFQAMWYAWQMMIRTCPLFRHP